MPDSWPLMRPRSRAQPFPRRARGRQSRCWRPSSGPKARGPRPDVWDSMHSIGGRGRRRKRTTVAGRQASAETRDFLGHDSLFREGDAMTDPIERPQSVPLEVLQRVPEGEPPPVPGDTQIAMQQLRAAGFSEDQQAALTTALLRVVALWTQQATRGDLQTELHAGEQRLAQQLNTLREEIGCEVAWHADALREEMRSEFTRYADLIHITRTEPARRTNVFQWLILTLLILTCAGVLLLVAHSVLGW